jgi:hypothetical protein
MAINSTSLTNTPQAGDDSYSYTEDQLLSSGLLSGNVVTLNVMSNDLGGNAKKLYSIDDGGSGFLNELMTKNVNTGWEPTGGGNQIRICNGQIELDISNSLTAKGAANVNALAQGETIHDEFVYTIQLGNGTLSWAKVTFDLVGMNDAPTDVSLSNVSIDENSAIGTAIGTLSTTDVDNGDTFVYSIEGGTGASLFTIDGDQVKVNGALDFESQSSYTLDVKTTDANGLSYTQSFTINVTNVNELDAITDTDTDANSVAENSTNGSVVQVTANAFDPEGDAVTYSLTDDASGRFAIDGTTGVVTVNGLLDFESATSHSITVQATDGDIIRTQSFTINVTDVVENTAPVAVDDRWFVSDNTTVAFPGSAMLMNDTDSDGNILSITALSTNGTTWLTDASDGSVDNVIHLDTTLGALTVNTFSGAITYATDNNNDAPSTTQYQTESFFYRVSDGSLTDDGTVTAMIINIESGNTTDIVNLNAAPYSADAQSYSYIDLRNGDDQLTGSLGADTFIGSQGNDMINIGIFGPNDDIDGGQQGNGVVESSRGDILVFDGNLDLTALAQDRITEIETMSMVDSAAGDALKLDVQDVLDLGSGTFDPIGGSGGGSIGNLYQQRDAIRVDGDSGDSLTLSAGGTGSWYQLAGATNVPAGYNLYVHETSGTSGVNEDAYVVIQNTIAVTTLA